MFVVSCPHSIRRYGWKLPAFFILLLLFYHFVGNTPISTSHALDSIDTLSECSTSSLAPTNPYRIPNIVHQIWKDANLSSYPIQPSFDSWKSVMKDLNYTVKLWTEEDIVQLVRTNYPWLIATYQHYPQNIQRADIARLVIVHSQGGIYADLDAYPRSAEAIQCVQSLGYEAILAQTSDNHGVSNHFFMAEKSSELLLWALHEAKRRARTNPKRFPIPYLEVFWSTGPLMITSASKEYSLAYNYAQAKRAVAVLDNSYIRTLIFHATGRSWHGADGRAINYIGDHIEMEKKLLAIVLVSTAIGVLYILLRRRR